MDTICRVMRDRCLHCLHLIAVVLFNSTVDLYDLGCGKWVNKDVSLDLVKITAEPFPHDILRWNHMYTDVPSWPLHIITIWNQKFRFSFDCFRLKWGDAKWSELATVLWCTHPPPLSPKLWSLYNFLLSKILMKCWTMSCICLQSYNKSLLLMLLQLCWRLLQSICS